MSSMEFKSFPEIKKLGSTEFSITQKIHGCFTGDTWITMSDGSRKTIKELVNSKEELHVMGYNNGELISTKVLNKFNNGESDNWVSVVLGKNSDRKEFRAKRIHCTPNHMFFCKNKNKYIEAQFLENGDSLIQINSNICLTFLQEQVLIGKMLGDGSYGSKSVYFGHKKDHEEYLNYTMNCLGYVAGNVQKTQISGFGTEMIRGRSKSLKAIENIFSKWTETGKKKIPKNLNLTPISIAFWYMDDGSLSHNDKQEDRALFATNGFDKEDVEILQRELLKFGIESVIFESNGLIIRLNAKDADKLFTLISPYILPVMQYKLPNRYRGLYNFKIPSQEEQYNKPISEEIVVNVIKANLSGKEKNKYDIETETHNYFADGILVHNSNAQVMIFENRNVVGMVPVDAAEKYIAIHLANNKNPYLKSVEVVPYSDKDSTLIETTTEVLVGSRTRWIAPGDDNYGFAAFVYANKQEFIDKLGLGQHFGEWAGPGINSGEGLKEKTFVLFDFWRYEGKVLPPQTTIVPVLYKGKFDLSKIETVMEDLKTNGSKLVPGFMRPEGIVAQIKGTRYKVVFDAEETQWKKPSGSKAPKIEGPDYSHLLQPIRLEKLISKDERYTTNYPASLKDIAFAYLDDLIKEGQIVGTESEINGIKKQASSAVFAFIKASFKEKGL